MFASSGGKRGPALTSASPTHDPYNGARHSGYGTRESSGISDRHTRRPSSSGGGASSQGCPQTTRVAPTTGPNAGRALSVWAAERRL